MLENMYFYHNPSSYAGAIFLTAYTYAWPLTSVIIRNIWVEKGSHSDLYSEPEFSLYTLSTASYLMENVTCKNNVGETFGACIDFGDQQNLNATIRYNFFSSPSSSAFDCE